MCEAQGLIPSTMSNRIIILAFGREVEGGHSEVLGQVQLHRQNKWWLKRNQKVTVETGLTEDSL